MSTTGAGERWAVLLLITTAASCAAITPPSGGGGNAGNGAISGSGGAGVSYASKLESAMATWAAAKPGCPAYHYNNDQWSVLGTCAITTIEISNDVPVGRSYIRGGCPPDPADPYTTQWDEVGAEQVGSHNAVQAATVEQLLADCENILGDAHSSVPRSLIIGDDGVPEVCSWTDTSCVDDCTSGLFISGFACDAPAP